MLGSIVTFILVLSILVIVHEFGHYIVARLKGVWVEEFGFGIPPRIWGKKIGETLYSINLFPFGGFVRLHGEASDEKVTKPTRSFSSKPKKVRFAIIFAGVVMNLVLAIVAFAVVYTFSGIPKKTDTVRVVDVASNSPAQEGGLLSGDIIESVNKVKQTTSEDFIKYVDSKRGEKITVTIVREVDGAKQEKDLKMTPRVTPPADQGPLGVTISTTQIYFPPVWQRPFIGIWWGMKESFWWGKTIMNSLVGMVVGLLQGRAPVDFAGPVGIYAVTTEAAKVGLLALINFVGVLSMNLAIFNVLPIPALDGGRLFFVVIESIFGKKVVPRIENAIHSIGLIVLVLLIILVTARDLVGLASAGGSVTKFLENLSNQVK